MDTEFFFALCPFLGRSVFLSLKALCTLVVYWSPLCLSLTVSMVYILAQKLALHSSPTHSIHRNDELLTLHFFFVTCWSRWALFGYFFLVVCYLILLGFARLKYLCICKYTCGSHDRFLQSYGANLELLWITKLFVWWVMEDNVELLFSIMLTIEPRIDNRF